PLARSDLHCRGQRRRSLVSIHAPLARSDVPPQRAPCALGGFNPRSSREERRPCSRDCCQTPGFQSTLLSRGATEALQPMPYDPVTFQSTLLSRGATICRWWAAVFRKFQSTLL